VDPDLVDAVVISHQHADHCTDILTAFHAWTYRPDPREGIPVLAPESLWDRVCSFVDKGQESVIDRTFDFRAVSDGDSAQFGDMRIDFTSMHHSVPCVGSRWEADDRTLFYTGDTGPGGSWREAGRGVDVMLCEASYQEETKDPDYPMHLSAAEAGQIARELGVGRLVLTHIPPYLEIAKSIHEAEQAFDRPVSMATPGTSFDV
jgi:ribonuclease BN (tRNA processing enzyme)